MLRINKRTNFDREDFDYTSVPKHFRSVADTEISSTKTKCIRSIAEKYKKDNYPAKVLGDMLRSISGEFMLLYNELEGDYNARKSNLEMAYNNGLALINQQVDEFDVIVAEYREACEMYSKALKNITGQEMDKSLIFDDKKLNHIRAEIDKMIEKQRNVA